VIELSKSKTGKVEDEQEQEVEEEWTGFDDDLAT
jgi:hypothetical protein